MTHRTLNWILAILIAALMSCTWMLDGPNDIDASRDVAADVIDATQAAQIAANTPKGVQP